MYHLCPVNDPRFQRHHPRPGLYFLVLPVAGLLWACGLSQPADLARIQADNVRLTKTLHTYLNHHDWQAAGDLCAETVCYWGRATHFAEVAESN